MKNMSTTFFELIQNPDNKENTEAMPNPDGISIPPSVNSSSTIPTCIDPVDPRVITLNLKRVTDRDQSQVEANWLITALYKCNSSIQPLIAISQVKNAFMYLAKYFSKNPLKIKNLVPLYLITWFKI